MAAQLENKTNVKEGKGALITFIVLFAIYFINVLLGKVSISFGWKIPHFGSVAEFLLLAIACVALIVAALKSEAAEN